MRVSIRRPSARPAKRAQRQKLQNQRVNLVLQRQKRMVPLIPYRRRMMLQLVRYPVLPATSTVTAQMRPQLSRQKARQTKLSAQRVDPCRRRMMLQLVRYPVLPATSTVTAHK